MNLDRLIEMYHDLKCSVLYVKELSPNDNSKNQIYFGGDFSVLNIIPFKEIIKDSSGERKTETFKSKLDFFWLGDTGELFQAPNAQLILYPDYPEVRFSGFLLGCKQSPKEKISSRLEGRLLFLGIDADGKVIGYVSLADSATNREYHSRKGEEKTGVFNILTIKSKRETDDSRLQLINELQKIHRKGWIESARLDKNGTIVPCNSRNCGGYTLEAELGIRANSKSEPDFLGWEVKSYGVKTFNRLGSAKLTLMDHSPDGGYFYEKGADAFIQKYGYADRSGIANRKNFGGVHKIGFRQKTTGLYMHVSDYDLQLHKVKSASLSVSLIDNNDKVAASWSYKSILEHWIKKHSRACYIPSIQRDISHGISSNKQYQYGNMLLLGIQTDVNYFLRELALGNVYYDPGFKLENIGSSVSRQAAKVRSLFRINVAKIPALYKKSETINLLNL